ncbi:MAG: biosynthetic-type acetolactate synthase large subunit [Oscillospiraceae bacterium]|nr:biosynthetic-type acetolactate synthase large subunit [Oscillospiraceae bacterium]
MPNGAQIILECLIEQGVDTVFGYPGGQTLGIYDALYNEKRIRHILTSSEAGAAHAADAYARVSGKTGVCIATSGPGATNLVTGIATAYMDSSAVVFITGNVPLGRIGTDSFQEVDITGITIPITKHNVMVKSADELASAIRFAFEAAGEGRPGPVLVDVPRDVQERLCEFTPPVSGDKPPEARAVSVREIEEAVSLIDSAEMPLLLCGGGVIRSGAAEAVERLAEGLNIPVATTVMGLGALPSSHRLNLGFCGVHGSREANSALDRCDLVIAVGVRFSDRIMEPGNRRKRILHIDIDRSEINKNVPAEKKIVGDAGAVLDRLADSCERRGRRLWEEKREKEEKPGRGRGVKPRDLKLIRQLFGEDLCVATDVGQHQMWAAQYIGAEKPGRFLTSGGMGTMGFGLGAAVGAQLALPGSRVVLVTGDGSFKMNSAELYTVSRNKLPIITVIMNNGTLGMVRQQQKQSCGGRYSQTGLEGNPDFALLARAYGVDGYTAATAEQLESALAAAKESGGAAVINCLVDIDETVRTRRARKD